MASSDVLSRTLHSITETKLDELSKRRSNFEKGKALLLQRMSSASVQSERVRILLDGIEKLPFMEKIDREAHPSVSLHNLRKFLEQAHCDPSVSQKLQKEWEGKLRNQLDVQSLRFEYASLYSRLVTEWLSNPASDAASESSSFEEIGRKEMHEQRATWESYVFRALETDTDAISNFLTSLFGSTKRHRKALENLRDSVKGFEEQLERETAFDESSLKWCIKGLLASDLLTDAKRAVLNDFSNNKLVLGELGDVLNLRMSSLENWSWGSKSTPVEQRRHLNGRYRFYHDEDLLQSIFLRFMGVKWSVKMKQVFKHFSSAEGVWTPATTPITKVDKERRKHFLEHGEVGGIANAEFIRQKLWREDCFLEQLLTVEDEGNRTYDEDDSDDSVDDRENLTRKNPQQIVQAVLHLLATDIIIKTRLGEDVTVLRTDFKWFGPSLPHSTMFEVLRFFGVSDRWIAFFQRALEAPMQFVQDGKEAPIQVRKRGTPISGPLSDFLGESVLFCLDYAVNQRTNGAHLFRLHDDIWFWGSEKSCESAWRAMREFSKIMGLEFNTEKTGSVRITRKGNKSPQVPRSLPVGDVRWGFLKLDAITGRFLIDQKQVDQHIVELRRQLAACNSVLDWIQAWNIYASRFFIVNFGRPANCNGRAHVDMMLSTFEKIQRSLFDDVHGRSVTDEVKKMLSDRFDVHDIPEGYLYFPMNMGGLDLRNPFIDLYQIRGDLAPNPDSILDTFFDAEDAAYRRAKERYEAGLVKGNESNDLKDAPFMSIEEYTRYRDQTSTELSIAFKGLMNEPRQDGAIMTKDVSSFLGFRSWVKLKPYQQWVVQLYASEMLERFGGLNVVEKGLLPTGMVNMFRSSRFNWAG